MEIFQRRPAALSALWKVLLPVAILLFLLCWRVWDFGITHTDDAWWLLRSHTSWFDASNDWAHWQGRLWAYVAGSLIMLALVWQGTVFGEVLRLGSFVLFFAAFHWTVAAYCGRRMALLAASLFVAFFALKWDGSILTTYPLISWPAGIACCGAMLAGRAYARQGGSRWRLAGAGLLLLFALFNNEGVTVLCIAMALLSVLANRGQGSDGRRERQLLLTFCAVAALYAILYLGWRHLYPTIYGGNTLAPFDLERIAGTLFHFSTSGSILHDLYAPLSMSYADTFGGARKATYVPMDYLAGLARSPLALLAGVLSAWLLWQQLGRPLAGPDPLAPAWRRGPLRRALCGGLVVALLPILPVALAVSYQNWAMELDVRAYSHTILAYFGWSLVLAALLHWLDARCRGQRLYRVLVLLLAAATGLVAAVAYRTNDAAAADMRPEAGRWNVVQRVVGVNAELFQSRVVWTPALLPRTQYGALLFHYWDDYLKALTGKTIEIGPRTPDINDLVHGVVMADYAWDQNARAMVLLFMQYRKDGPAGGFIGGAVAVDIGGADPRDYLLEYQGQDVALPSLPARRPGLYLFTPPPGTDPASVRLLRAGAGEPALAAIRLPRTLRVDMRRPLVPAPALDPASLLDAGWHTPDADGVWSRGGEAHLRIPRALVPAGPLRLELNLASYTSMGFSKGLQRMAVSVNGVPVGKWDFPYQNNPTIALDLPPGATAGTGDFDLKLEVEPGMVPRALGGPPIDARELGVQLRWVILAAQGAPPQS